MTRRTLAAEALPESARIALQTLGENLSVAMKRRQIKRAEMAERALISQPTLRAVLKGEPSTSIGAYLAVLAVLGLDEQLADLAHPAQDELGQALEKRRLPKRIRSRESQYDF